MNQAAYNTLVSAAPGQAEPPTHVISSTPVVTTLAPPTSTVQDCGHARDAVVLGHVHVWSYKRVRGPLFPAGDAIR